MEKVVILLVLIHCVLCFPEVSASECVRETIRLSLASVRDGRRSSASRHALQGNYCDGERTQLICADAEYPNDVMCDAGPLWNDPMWEGRPRIMRIEVDYEHETVRNGICQLKFNADGEDGENFEFVGAECATDVPDETVPRFRVSKAIRLKIFVIPERKKLPRGECLRKEFVLDREETHNVPEVGLGLGKSEVKFILNVSCCDNDAPSFIGGRKTPSPFKFTHDGRRYRPK